MFNAAIIMKSLGLDPDKLKEQGEAYVERGFIELQALNATLANIHSRLNAIEERLSLEQCEVKLSYAILSGAVPESETENKQAE